MFHRSKYVHMSTKDILLVPANVHMKGKKEKEKVIVMVHGWCINTNSSFTELLTLSQLYMVPAYTHIDGLVRDFCNPSTLAMELSQSCGKPLKCDYTLCAIMSRYQSPEWQLYKSRDCRQQLVIDQFMNGTINAGSWQCHWYTMEGIGHRYRYRHRYSIAAPLDDNCCVMTYPCYFDKYTMLLK